MENKYIERDIDKLVSKYGKNNDYSLDGTSRGFKISQYIEQLEQEVKELNACIDRNEKSHLFFTDNQVKIIEQLKQEDEDLSDCIGNLEKQLHLKDKALNNACHFIQEIGFNRDWGGMPQCEKCDYLNSPSACWDCEGNLKKMFENNVSVKEGLKHEK